MDIAAARTFLEVLKTGSFVAAASNLNLTQTAVSARIRVLEQQLNRQLFVRNKAGVRLTLAGEQFQRYAVTLVQVWERARQQVSLPVGRDAVASIGGEYNLWNPLLRNLLEWMHRECPDVAVRAHIDVGDRLMDQVQEGVLDIAVVYAPPRRHGVVSELLLDEKLIAVSSTPGTSSLGSGYVHVDWSPAFTASHHAAFPESINPAVAANFGPLAMEYILAVGGSGYFRKAAAEPHLGSGRLHLIKDAPQFSYSVYAVYSPKVEVETQDRVKQGLRAVASELAH